MTEQQEHKELVAHTRDFLEKLRVEKQLYSAAITGLSRGIEDNIKKLEEYDLDGKMESATEDLAVILADTLNQDLADAETIEKGLIEMEEEEDKLLTDDQLTPDDIPQEERHE